MKDKFYPEPPALRRLANGGNSVGLSQLDGVILSGPGSFFAMVVAVLGIKRKASYMQLYQLSLLDRRLRL